MPLLAPAKFKALLAQRRAMAERSAEKRQAKLQVQAEQRQLRKAHKRKERVRPGRLGATELEEFSQAQLDHRIALLGSRCLYCSGPFQHLDHLVPVACGGRHALWNLVPSCRACNLSKKDSDPLEWASRKAINKAAVLLVERAVRRHARKMNA
jgi:5-methylcytosine-specific restriction endonuclease McrA